MKREDILDWGLTRLHKANKTVASLWVLLANGQRFEVDRVSEEWSLQTKRMYTTSSVSRAENDSEDRSFGMNINGDTTVESASSLKDKEFAGLMETLAPYADQIDELLKLEDNTWVAFRINGLYPVATGTLERVKYLCEGGSDWVALRCSAGATYGADLQNSTYNANELYNYLSCDYERDKRVDSPVAYESWSND